jgi:hypothetical protein
MASRMRSRVAGQGREEPVGANDVTQALVVGDGQGLVSAPAKLARLDAALGGQQGGAEPAEHVVVWGAAGVAAGAEAVEQVQPVQPVQRDQAAFYSS